VIYSAISSQEVLLQFLCRFLRHLAHLIRKVLPLLRQIKA